METKSSPIAQFPLRWRFTDPKYNVLPDEVLQRFHPLDAQSASELCFETRNFVSSYAINAEGFPKIDQFDTNGDVDKVREWLTDSLQNLDQAVEISWDPTTAMIVRLQDFCDYWNDFCYPGSDDVVVLPKARDWVLYYFHEEAFYIGRKTL